MTKKPKRQFNARLKEETFFAIQALAERWECTQAEVIERVIKDIPIPAGAGTISLPPMVEDQTHWEIPGVGKAVPTDDLSEFKIEYDAE